MTPEQRLRRIEQITREIAALVRNRLVPNQASSREAELQQELARLQREPQVDPMLDLPMMNENVLRGSQGKSAGVPMMITMAMRARLQARGYIDGEIDAMTPQQAWKILEGPESGG